MMKSKLLLLGLLLCSVGVFAQKPLSIGIKGGYSSSKVTTKLNVDENSINNYIAGAMVRINMSKLYLQPEAYFSTKGGKWGSDAIDFKTIDVPVLLGVKFLDLKVAKLRINAGPVMSFITDKKIKVEGADEKKFKDNFVGFQYGAGVDVLNFTLDARFENSFGNLNSGPEGGKSKIFMLTLGIFIL